MIADLSQEERKALLAWARSSIAARWSAAEIQPPAGAFGETTCGAFVSLHKDGALRGCIGRIVGGGPLLETLGDMARAAAFEDPRFKPLQREELDQVDIEITLLSPLKRVDAVSRLEIGRHGLYIVKGWHSGLLLPQVATQFGWDMPSFLAQVCRKAGLEEEAWRSPQAELFCFEGLVFGEKNSKA